MQLEQNRSSTEFEPTASTPLEEAIARWDFELGLAAAFLPEDPLNALEWSRRIEAELEAEMQRDRGSEAVLAQLRGEAHTLAEESYASSRVFLDETERRHQDFEAREQDVFSHPLKSLRRPWPGRTEEA